MTFKDINLLKKIRKVIGSDIDEYVDALKPKYKMLPVAFSPTVYGGYISDKQIYYPIVGINYDEQALKRGYLQPNKEYSLKGQAFKKGWIKVGWSQSMLPQQFTFDYTTKRQLTISLNPEKALKSSKSLLTLLHTLRFYDNLFPNLTFNIRLIDFMPNINKQRIKGQVVDNVYYTIVYKKFKQLKSVETYLNGLHNNHNWILNEIAQPLIEEASLGNMLSKIDMVTKRIKLGPFRAIKFMLKDQGETVASLDIIDDPVDKSKDGYLCNVFVDQTRRKGGLGTQLLNWVTSSLNNIKRPKFLKVGCYGSGDKLNNQQLQDFYSRFGFQPSNSKFWPGFGEPGQQLMELKCDI